MVHEYLIPIEKDWLVESITGGDPVSDTNGRIIGETRPGDIWKAQHLFFGGEEPMIWAIGQFGEGVWLLLDNIQPMKKLDYGSSRRPQGG